MTDLLNRRDQIAVGVPRSGDGLAITSGTFIGFDSAGNAVQANAASGTAQVPAIGFALAGEDIGHPFGSTFQTQRFSAVDTPHGIATVNSGGFVVGRPIYLSGGGSNLNNFSQTPPSNRGDLVQMLGIMVTNTTFRIKIGEPFAVVGVASAQTSGTVISTLRPWRGAGLDS